MVRTCGKTQCAVQKAMDTGMYWKDNTFGTKTNVDPRVYDLDGGKKLKTIPLDIRESEGTVNHF